MRLLFIHGYAGRIGDISRHGMLPLQREYYTAWTGVADTVWVATPDTEEHLIDDSGRVVHVPLGARRSGIGGWPAHRVHLRRALRRLRPDVIIADMTAAPLLWPEGVDRPLLVRAEWFWSDVARQEDSPLEAGVKLRLERFMATRADAVSASGRLVARRIEELGARRVSVVPNCVAAPFFDEGRHRSLASGRRSASILSAGRLVAIKRHALLIDALAAVSPERRPTLVLAGDGPLKAELLERADRRSVRLEHLGSVENDRMASLMGRVDALVHVSSHEGSPRVILEAFAAALPVYTTVWPGCDELIGVGSERGRTLPDTAGGIARILDGLEAGSLERGETAAAARTWAAERCTVQAHVAATLQLISAVRRDGRTG